MTSDLLISIIVPVYNVERYINTCLTTILNQTYNNLEIIIVASTSNDNSVDLCKFFFNIDSRIKIIHSDPNGLSDARNKGICASTGSYLSFIDSDDYIAPNFIETLYNICIENECDIAQCSFFRVNNDEDDLIYDDPKEIKKFTGIEMCYNLYNELSIESVVTWSKLYRRELFNDICFPVGKLHEDEATSYKLFYNAKSVGVTRQKLYYYRNVKTSIMGSEFTLKRLDGLEFVENQRIFYESINQQALSRLALVNCFYVVNDFIYNTKKYVKNSKKNQRMLIEKRNLYIRLILHDNNIPCIIKIKILINSFVPYEIRKQFVRFKKIINID